MLNLLQAANEAASKTESLTSEVTLPPLDGLPPIAQYVVLALAAIATAALAWKGIKLVVKVGKKPV